MLWVLLNACIIDKHAHQVVGHVQIQPVTISADQSINNAIMCLEDQYAGDIERNASRIAIPNAERLFNS
jgi:hypothetical protein